MRIAPIREINHQPVPILVIGYLLLAFFISACAGEDEASQDTGSYTCTLIWPDDVPTLELTSRTAQAIDCDAAGVTTVAFDFYDGSGTYLTGDEWSCSLHDGTAHGILAGTNRRLVATGKDASGTVLYQGEKTGITIVAGQITYGGEIDMEAVIPSDFSTADLEGTWDFHRLTSGDSPQWIGWAYGNIDIDSNGNVTVTSFTRSSEDGDIPDNFSMAISSSGVVTIPSTDTHGIMNSQKDMIVSVKTDAGGGYSLHVWTKESGTSFSTSDLQGTWNFHMLTSGDSPQWIGWLYATGNMDANGNFTCTSTTKSDGDSTLPADSIMALSSSGVVTIAGTDFHGTMSSQKDMIVGVMTDGGGGYNLIIWTKESGASFTTGDLQGTWMYHGSISGDSPAQTPGWYWGEHTLDGSGNVTSSTPVTDSLGNSDYTPSIGAFPISSDGVLTESGGLFRGVMNDRKNMIIGVATMCPGSDTDVCGYNLVVMVKES